MKRYISLKKFYEKNINIKKFDKFEKDRGKKDYVLRFSYNIKNDIKEGVSYHQTDCSSLQDFVIKFTQQKNRPQEWWYRNYEINSQYDIEFMNEKSKEFKELLQDTIDDLQENNNEIIGIKKIKNKIVIVQSGLNGFLIDASNAEDALAEIIKIINKRIKFNYGNYGGKAYLIATEVIDTIDEGITFNAKKSDILAEVF